MSEKLYDSYLRILKLLWEYGDLTAAQLSNLCQADVGWNRNTTYTVIKKCVEKGFVQRIEPRFLCHALLTKDQAQAQEVRRLTEQLFNGDHDDLIAYLKKQPCTRPFA